MNIGEGIVLGPLVVAIDCLGHVESGIDRVVRVHAQLVYVLVLVRQATNNQIADTSFCTELIKTLVG